MGQEPTASAEQGTYAEDEDRSTRRTTDLCYGLSRATDHARIAAPRASPSRPGRPGGPQDSGPNGPVLLRDAVLTASPAVVHGQARITPATTRVVARPALPCRSRGSAPAAASDAPQGRCYGSAPRRGQRSKPARLEGGRVDPRWVGCRLRQARASERPGAACEHGRLRRYAAACTESKAVSTSRKPMSARRIVPSLTS